MVPETNLFSSHSERLSQSLNISLSHSKSDENHLCETRVAFISYISWSNVWLQKKRGWAKLILEGKLGRLVH